MISKELFNAVSGIDSKFLDQKPTCIEYECDGVYNFINIYELAHKCKEWALGKGFDIDTNFSGLFRISQVRDDSFFYVVFDGEANNELEAIFKACQWILDNMEAN